MHAAGVNAISPRGKNIKIGNRVKRILCPQTLSKPVSQGQKNLWRSLLSFRTESNGVNVLLLCKFVNDIGQKDKKIRKAKAS